MAYVAVSGGEEAIAASIALLDFYRSKTEKDVELEVIQEKMSLLVDRVMSEAGLYAKEYAALALKQCEGSVEEAVFLLRAYRSTLKRSYDTYVADTKNMRIVRRISAAFKDIQGGQILGATYDYTHRLMHFDLKNEDAAKLHERMEEMVEGQEPVPMEPCGRVSDELKTEGLIERFPINEEPPYDVTENLLEFPASRSARLQTLTRADAGFISGLAYSVLRGFGQVHPTVGELRTGYVELEIPYLQQEGETLWIGEVMLTEVEVFNEAEDKDALKLACGYGAVFGRNENKAIAMAVIDRELDAGGDYPTQDEEFVLMHGDSLEMNGFISHLKLPHYVTFQSKLDAVRKTRRENNRDTTIAAAITMERNFFMVHSSFCLVFSSLFRFIIIQRTCYWSVPPLYRPPQAKTAPRALRFIPPSRKEPRIPWYNLRLCRRDTEKAQISYASSLYLCTAFLARGNFGCNRTVTFSFIFKQEKNAIFH